MMNRVVAAVIVALAALLLNFWFLSPARLEARVRASLPPASSRAQVRTFLGSQPAQAWTAAFDYPHGHPMRGRVLIVSLRTRLPPGTIHTLWVFDARDRLLSHQVSARPLAPPLPP